MCVCDDGWEAVVQVAAWMEAMVVAVAARAAVARMAVELWWGHRWCWWVGRVQWRGG